MALFSISDNAPTHLAPQRTWPELKEGVQDRYAIGFITFGDIAIHRVALKVNQGEFEPSKR